MHTSQKGDIGLCHVITSFTEAGYYISLPLSEHLPYDLIVDDGISNLLRIQVKYSTITKKGIITLRLSTSSCVVGGYKRKIYDADTVDGFVVYCPDVNSLYYFNSCEVAGMTAVNLRTTPPKNNQKRGIWLAEDYIDVNRIMT